MSADAQKTPTQQPMTSAGVRWHTSDHCPAALTHDDAPDWFELGGDPRAELVKRNPLREVYRVTLSCGVFFAKVFHHRGVAATLKRWVVGPPAVAELRTADALSGARVRAIRALAAGVSPSGDRSILLSEEFDGAETLAELWEGSRPPPPGIAESLAAFLAKSHERRVLPRDVHAGNFLVRRGAAAGEWEIAYADLAGMRIERSVTDREAARTIAELYQWFRARSSAAQRVRFLRAYTLRRFGENHALRRQFAHLVEEAAAAHQRRLWAKRDRRIFGTNAYFARVRPGDGWTAHLVLRCRGRDPQLMPFQGERTLAQWRQWLARHFPDLDAEPPAALSDNIQVYRRRGGRCGSLWPKPAGSPLRRSFAVAHALRHRDLPALHAPALFERKSLGTVLSVLMIHQPEGTHSLSQMASRLPSDGDGDRCRLFRQLVRAGGRLLAAMVECRVTARDLTPDTFAVVPGADTTTPIVCIADFRGLTIHRRAVSQAVARMPACLLRSRPGDVTRTDCLRFLLAYWRRLPHGLRRGGWKALWRQIETVM